MARLEINFSLFKVITYSSIILEYVDRGFPIFNDALCEPAPCTHLLLVVPILMRAIR